MILDIQTQSRLLIKKMVIVKIEDKMSPNSIAVAALNKKADWKYWWWVPENYIKEIL